MFLTKAELEATVEAYGLNVEGLNWPQKQGYVSRYLAANDLEVVKPKEEDGGGRESAFEPIDGQMFIADAIAQTIEEKGADVDGDLISVSGYSITPEQCKDGASHPFFIEETSDKQTKDQDEISFDEALVNSINLTNKMLFKDKQKEKRRIQGDMTRPSAASTSTLSMHIPTPGEPVIIKGKAKRVQVDPVEETVDEWLALGLKNKRLMFAPELITDPNRLIRYREDLGPNATSEDVNYTGEDLDRRNIQGAPGTSNGISGTYQVTEIPGERCVATSTLPKYNAAIYWDFGPDGQPRTYFPIVEFEGRRGYLYKHATIPNVYSTIFSDPRMRERGYYQRFRENLSQEPYVFYLAGILAVDIDFTHYMMEEITKEEQRRND